MPHVKLVWSPYAFLGVQLAYRFLAEKHSDVVKAAAGIIKKQAALLKKFPGAGRLVDALDPELRDLLIPFSVSGYVRVYEVHADVILMLAVRHQKEAGC